MNGGYIKLWRTSVLNKDYFAQPFTRWQAWLDLLLLTNYKEGNTLIRGVVVTIKPGQAMISERFLAQRWRWSRGKVERFLEYLSSKTVHQIEPQKNNIVTIISIVNWEQYQGNGTTDDTKDNTTDEPQTSHKQGQPKNSIRRDKNSKEDKNIYIHVFELWNSKKIIVHQKLTDEIRTSISAKLRVYSVDDLCKAISNYAEITLSPMYYFKYKWTLKDFLARGIEKFLDGDVAKQNYKDKDAPKPQNDYYKTLEGPN